MDAEDIANSSNDAHSELTDSTENCGDALNNTLNQSGDNIARNILRFFQRLNPLAYVLSTLLKNGNKIFEGFRIGNILKQATETIGSSIDVIAKIGKPF